MKSKLHIRGDGIAAKTESAPLGAQEINALFAPFSLPMRIALALSGGPYSMALALTVKNWLAAKNDGTTALAFIVDHGLRAESVAESKQTQKALNKLGLK